MTLLTPHTGMQCRNCFIDISPYRIDQLNIYMKDEEIFKFDPNADDCLHQYI